MTPVPEGTSFSSRPARLLDEVRKLTGVDVDVERGGRATSLGANLERLSELVRPRPGTPCWCFHPLYLVREANAATWVDAYDDWSLAPEMSRLVRVIAARGYSRVRATRTHAALVTVNSRYMQLKLHPRATVVVPNGVDPGLADVPTSGDDRRRVLVMGHFFRGRTDWALLEEILNATTVHETLVIGHHPRVDAMVAAAHECGRKVLQLPPTSFRDLAGKIGPRTALAVPHVVSDYTLSQDLMKVYQAVAMGMSVCVPNALWPPAVTRDVGFVFERGVAVERVLAGTADLVIGSEQRRAFADEHAWSRRAQQIADALPVLS